MTTLESVCNTITEAKEVEQVKVQLQEALELVKTSERRQVEKFLVFLVDVVLLDWAPFFVSSDWEQYFDPHFRVANPVSVFLILTKGLNTKSKGNHKSAFSFLVTHTLRLLHAFFATQRFSEMLLEVLKNKNTRTMWSQVLQTIVSLPERAANRLKEKLDSFFLPVTYFRTIANLFFDFAEFLDKQDKSKDLWEDLFREIPIFSHIFDKISFLGYAGAVTQKMVPFVIGRSESVDWMNRISEIVKNLSKGCEAFLESFFCMQVDLFGSVNGNVTYHIFSPLVVSHQTYHFLLTGKFLTEKILPARVQRGILDLLVRVQENQRGKEDEYVLLLALSNLLSIWSSATFLKNSTDSQHSYICRGILRILESKYITKQQMEGEKNSFNILSKLMGGVHNHLEYPLKERRYRGMRIGEAFSKILNPETPLNFEIPEDEISSDDTNASLSSDRRTKPHSLFSSLSNNSFFSSLFNNSFFSSLFDNTFFSSLFNDAFFSSLSINSFFSSLFRLFYSVFSLFSDWETFCCCQRNDTQVGFFFFGIFFGIFGMRPG
eukprot:TRINITY_DN1538_c0_g1_i4.p1 TRINITY_DN1538_c0_g1~~TRINITY_DN1538_c0_g1_i4.p1  ORF type:complete len:554 (+),score=115.56 TRINITY_DN1538_c0_g1_i4:24-1664(+)